MNWAYLSCDSLWLPPCPKCSNVTFFRSSNEDRLETPGFFVARCTTQKYGVTYWMLRGCSHATQISLDKGPIPNRLKLAVAWRRKVRVLGAECYVRGFSTEIRDLIMNRLGHPEINLGAAYEQ